MSHKFCLHCNFALHILKLKEIFFEVYVHLYEVLIFIVTKMDADTKDE